MTFDEQMNVYIESHHKARKRDRTREREREGKRETDAIEEFVAVTYPYHTKKKNER